MSLDEAIAALDVDKVQASSEKPTSAHLHKLVETLSTQLDEGSTDKNTVKRSGVKIAKLLLEKGADPNGLDSEGRTPLMTAIILSTFDTMFFIVDVLIEKTDVNIQGPGGNTALMLAILGENEDIVEYLMEKPGIDTSLKNNTGSTALEIAVSVGDDDIVDLVEAGPKESEAEEEEGVQLKDIAQHILDKDYDEAIELIPGITFDVNKSLFNNRTLLWYSLATIPLLYKVLAIPGIDPNVIDGLGTTALYEAARYPDAMRLVKLIASGADVNLKTGFGSTPLMNAVDLLRVENVMRLIQKGADVYAVDSEGKTVVDSLDESKEEAMDAESDAALEKIAQIQTLINNAPAPASPASAAPPPKLDVKRVAEDEAYVANALKLPGFEVRAFRGKLNNIVPVYVTTIPKGTLLFRGVRTTETLKQDFFGMKKDNGTHCLPPHYNVFFYPFPFVDETVGSYSTLAVYAIANDIKIACYISPTPMSRADRNITDMSTISCNALTAAEHGCGMAGRGYDPCFNHTFLTNNPDVVGMIAIAGQDRSEFVKRVQDVPEFKAYLNVFFSTYIDSHSLYPGIPELVLYPRVHRRIDSVSMPATAKLTEWLLENKTETAYTLCHMMDRTPEKIKDFMEKVTSVDGFEGIRAQIDKTTGFYVNVGIADKSIEASLLPPGEIGKMADSFPELRFTRATFLPGATAGGSRRWKTYRRRRHARI